MTFVRASLLAPLVLAAAIGACSAQPVPPPPGPPYEIYGPRQPPPPRVEVVPEPFRPGEVWVWRRGHWQWDGREFVWVKGHYEERPRAGMVWVPDQWVRRGDRWVFIPGYFR